MPYADLLPAQHLGARFLAGDGHKLLADEPGYGKTAQAVLAADDVMARRVLVVTTAAARTNWLNEFRLWGMFDRTGQAVFGTKTRIDPTAEVVVIAWSLVWRPAILAQLLEQRFDVLILDEAHYAKGRLSRTTAATFGGYNEDGTRRIPEEGPQGALADVCERVWCLTGTPIPNSVADLYPMLRALWPETLAHVHGRYDRFEARYCVVRISNKGNTPIKVIVNGKNESELGGIIRPVYLRRLAKDLPPLTTSLFFLDTQVAARELRQLEEAIDGEALQRAYEAGRPISEDDMPGLAELMRRQAEVKARAVVEWLTIELAATKGAGNALDSVVIFHQHTEAGRILREGLKQFGVVHIDGSVPGDRREGVVQSFQTLPSIRVIVLQLQAASEAITVTKACNVVYAETSIVPARMDQSVRRILRRGQKRSCIARIATLPGSLDARLQAIVTRKMQSIKKVLGE